MSLKISNLNIAVEGNEIVHGLNLEINKGEVHVIMGPNGSGKSTLANTLMGHPKYTVMNGSIEIDGKNVTWEPTDERARLGLFLSMQYLPEITGVTITNFLRTAYNALHEEMDALTFHKFLIEKMESLGMDKSFGKRYVNVGFSGGEKKRAEILQLGVLDPTYAILDETDSGLDVDALKIVAEGINRFKGKDKGVLLITHYNRILEYIVPDYVHIMKDGKIVESGGKELALKVEKEGYLNN